MISFAVLVTVMNVCSLIIRLIMKIALELSLSTYYSQTLSRFIALLHRTTAFAAGFPLDV